MKVKAFVQGFWEGFREEVPLWALILVGVVAVIIVVNVASGDDESEKESDSGRKAEQTTPAKKSKPKPQPSDSTLLRRELRENFGPATPLGKATWWDFIKKVEVAAGHAYITTDMYADDSDPENPARSICRAVLLVGQSADARVKINSAEVLGRPALATLDECKPGF